MSNIKIKKEDVGSILLGFLSLTAAIIRLKAKSIEKDNKKMTDEFMINSQKFAEDTIKDCREICKSFNTSFSRNRNGAYPHSEDYRRYTKSVAERIKRAKLEKHLNNLMEEAIARADDGLSAEEKAEKVKEAARRMGYDVGD